jgi:hypothetical protein
MGTTISSAPSSRHVLRRTTFDYRRRDGRIADGRTVLLLQGAALDGPFSPAARAH